MYLSADMPRWQPKTEADLTAAAESGLLEETHYLELKRELVAKPSSNKEFARDLAQFAIDGGTLIIGMEEREDAPPELHPVPLKGLAERVEQIATTIPDPPLHISSTAIRSEADPEFGYLLVQVPVSGRAPHMVEKVYYGRGDKTKRRLDDPEVRRLHAAQEDEQDLIRAALDGYIQRDPIDLPDRKHAHLFVVATPIPIRPDLCYDLLELGEAQETLNSLAWATRTADLNINPAFQPCLASAHSFARRSDGAALTSGLTEARVVDPGQFHREQVFEFELSEDGIIRLMTTRLSDEPTSGTGEQVFALMIPVIVRQCVFLASKVSEKTGYAGLWGFGVAATGMQGLSAYTDGGRFGRSNAVYPKQSPDYRRIAVGSTQAVTASGGAMTADLVGRLLRSLGVGDLYRPYLTDRSDDGPEGDGQP